MGSVGDAYDNAMAESFFASLECELAVPNMQARPWTQCPLRRGVSYAGKNRSLKI